MEKNIHYKKITALICPNCGKRCNIGIACSCEAGTNFNVLEKRRGKGLICVGYTDAQGNIWRFR